MSGKICAICYIIFIFTCGVCFSPPWAYEEVSIGDFFENDTCWEFVGQMIRLYSFYPPGLPLSK